MQAEPTIRPLAMHGMRARSIAFRAGALGVAAILLAGCVTTQAGRIGADDGSDPCRAQLVALDSTGNFFAEDIIKGVVVGAVAGGLIGGLASGNWRGAAIGAAAGAAVGGATGYFVAVQQQQRDQAGIVTQVRGDLGRENAELDRTQAAFDTLTSCRFRQAEQVREDFRAGRITREAAQQRLQAIRTRHERDVALARSINDKVAGRQEQFAEAAENLSPGTKTGIEQRRAAAPRRATIATAAPLKVSPDPQGPAVAQVSARQQVTVKSQRDGFALVETDDGRQGFVPVSAVQGGVRATPSAGGGSSGAAAAGDTGEVRTLAASNAAKRDNFSDSIAVAERAGASGFDLS